MSTDTAGDTILPPTEALHAVYYQFDAAGLRMPPIPRDLLGKFQVFDDWRFGTRDVDPGDRSALAVEAADSAVQDYVAFGHVGHGVNSWWICCRLVVGPLAVYVRHGFGGAYQDSAAGAAAVHHSFLRVEELIVGAESARRTGVLPAGSRLLVIQDDQQGSGWRIAGVRETSWSPARDAFTPALECVGLGAGSV